MKIILKLIPPAEVNLLAATVLQSAKAFYADPQNEARYQAWKAERERKGVNQYFDKLKSSGTAIVKAALKKM